MIMKTFIVCATVWVALVACTGCQAKETPSATETAGNAVIESTDTEQPQDLPASPEALDMVEPETSDETEPSDEPDADDVEMIRTYGKWVNEPLDSETAAFFYGEWEVKTLLGFANSYNDASEYPTGQDIIGDRIIIHEDLFMSMGLEGYPAYQYNLANPSYEVQQTFYNKDAFYRSYKALLEEMPFDAVVKTIKVTAPDEANTTVSFFMVNGDRLLLSIEATFFELHKFAE